MGYDYGAPGLGSVGQYQMSGQPFLTGAAMIGANPLNGQVVVNFPYVTKSFTVINRGDKPILVHFYNRSNTDTITYKHYFTLPTLDDAYSFSVRSKQVYVSMENVADNGSFQIHAELTSITSREMGIYSGSGVNSID
jgi:hypothetical protein